MDHSILLRNVSRIINYSWHSITIYRSSTLSILYSIKGKIQTSTYQYGGLLTRNQATGKVQRSTSRVFASTPPLGTSSCWQCPTEEPSFRRWLIKGITSLMCRTADSETFLGQMELAMLKKNGYSSIIGFTVIKQNTQTVYFSLIQLLFHKQAL